MNIDCSRISNKIDNLLDKVWPDDKNSACRLKDGDRVKIVRLIPPEDLPVGSEGIVVGPGQPHIHGMLIVAWDVGWRGLYHQDDLQVV